MPYHGASENSRGERPCGDPLIWTIYRMLRDVLARELAATGVEWWFQSGDFGPDDVDSAAIHLFWHANGTSAFTTIARVSPIGGTVGVETYPPSRFLALSGHGADAYAPYFWFETARDAIDEAARTLSARSYRQLALLRTAREK